MEEVFVATSNAPEAFDLVSPQDNLDPAPLFPHFEWNATTDPDAGDQVTYSIVIANDQALNDVVFQATNIADPWFDLTEQVLQNARTYYWAATSHDSCADSPNETRSSQVYTFTTVAECANPPDGFALVSPANGAVNQSITSTLSWLVPVDLDPNDTMVYEVQMNTVDDFQNPPIVFQNITGNSFPIPLADALDYDTEYFWRVLGWDGCNNPTVSQAVFSFRTEMGCMPFSFTETDFTTGDATDLVVSNGSITLPEDYNAWTYQYDATGLPLPAEGWVVNGSPNGSAAGGILTINTLGSNLQGYYEKTDASFVNGTGSVVEIRVKIDGEDEITPPSASGFALMVADGQRRLAFTFFSNQICEPNNTGSCQVTDTTTYHTYRLEFQGNDYMFYRDGAVFFNGIGMSLSGASGMNYVWFGDTSVNPDAAASVDYLYYYNSGNQIPYVASGEYVTPSQLPDVINTGIIDFSYSGATIGWIPPTSAGEVSIYVRAANNSGGLISAPWSSALTNNPAALPNITGQYLQLMLVLNTVDPANPPTVDEVNIEKVCP
jgi:hypothetical protein